MDNLLQKRASRHFAKMMKYMKYIFNDHFVIVLAFLLGAIAMYYSNLLQVMEAGSVYGKVISLLALCALPMFCGLSTLLEPADMQFLLPKEIQMNKYVERAFNRSLILPFLAEFLLVAFLMPLIVVSTNGELIQFPVYLLVAWAIKCIALRFETRWLYQGTRGNQTQMKALIFFLSFLSFAYLLFVGWFIPIIPVLLFAVTITLSRQKPSSAFDWEYAIELEKKRMHRIYKFISLFTDVPEITTSVKRRKYLDGLLAKVPRQHKNTYMYLFARSLARGSEYSGLVFRLTGIGAVLTFFIHEEILSLVIGALFIYLIGFQLIPLYSQFDYMLLNRLYPVSLEEKQKDIQKLITIILSAVGVVFYLISLISLPKTPLALAIILIYLAEIFLFTRIYLNKRLRKMEN